MFTEVGGIEPLRHLSRTTVFKTACHPFSGNFHFFRVSDETRTRYLLASQTSVSTTLTSDTKTHTPDWTRTSKNLALNKICLPVASQRLIGMVGFEPTTPCSQNMASSPLNYIPSVPSVGVEPTKSGF